MCTYKISITYYNYMADLGVDNAVGSNTLTIRAKDRADLSVKVAQYVERNIVIDRYEYEIKEVLK